MTCFAEYNQKKYEIGARLCQFRELLGKSLEEMNQEGKENVTLFDNLDIDRIECGLDMPGIFLNQYLIEEYGLNLTWLVTGRGFIFAKKGPKTPGNIYYIFRDTEPTEQLINDTLRWRQQENETYIPNQNPVDCTELDSSMKEDDEDDEDMDRLWEVRLEWYNEGLQMSWNPVNIDKEDESYIKLHKQIGRRFKRFRKNLGFSQEELAKKIRTNVKNIKMIEMGKEPKATTFLNILMQLYEKYGLHARWLIEDFKKKKERRKKMEDR